MLTHIAFTARNLEATLAFYADLCGMRLVHDRGEGAKRVAWLAEPGKETEFVFVFMEGPFAQPQDPRDFGHLGFALESREAVDAIAERARAAGCLEWAPRQEEYPVGYYCGVRDPEGRFVEFSFGQPLGPGSTP